MHDSKTLSPLLMHRLESWWWQDVNPTAGCKAISSCSSHRHTSHDSDSLILNATSNWWQTLTCAPNLRRSLSRTTGRWTRGAAGLGAAPCKAPSLAAAGSGPVCSLGGPSWPPAAALLASNAFLQTRMNDRLQRSQEPGQQMSTDWGYGSVARTTAIGPG